MPDRLVLDYDNMLSSRIGANGIDPAALDDLADRFTALHESVEQRRLTGELAFFGLPHDAATVREIREFAEGVGQAFDTVVVLGIGGSALGTTALQQALLKPFWNELDDEARDYFPRLYVLDNIDPSTIAPLFERIDFARTLFNVVSKSGATAETMAQFLIVREKLHEVFGDDEGYRRHLIFTTDPEKGVLRRLAIEENIATLPVPAGVGGRFSVLSAVGLLPAALVGIDIDALLAGAAAMAERCARPRLRDNPAGIFAALQYLADTERDAPIHVMMPYGDRLAGLADWFRQLWAESLGKRTDLSGREIFAGPTPVKALGATDQHSQVQLYMEGPPDKTITLVGTRTLPVDVGIPRAYADVDELGYLGGRTLGELLDAERVATTAALASQGRMNMTIELPAITAHALGQFIMMLQIATVYAGGLYGINPLDQPGVELGKQLTYGLMGRRGFSPPESGARAEAASSPPNTVR
jgi:glucose-6-phosphate isomerase